MANGPKNAAHALIEKIMDMPNVPRGAGAKKRWEVTPVRFRIGDLEDKVTMEFNRPVQVLTITPEQGLLIAEKFAHHAALAHDFEEQLKNPAGLILPDDGASKIIRG